MESWIVIVQHAQPSISEERDIKLLASMVGKGI